MLFNTITRVQSYHILHTYNEQPYRPLDLGVIRQTASARSPRRGRMRDVNERMGKGLARTQR
jgi:hypothetical protein